MKSFTRRDTLKTLLLSSGALLYEGAHASSSYRQTMRKRKIPSSGEAIGVVGVGTWQTFDVGASQKARAPLQEVLKILVEMGGEVIDSSPMYGRSEEVAGELSAGLGLQDQLFYATKVWTTGREEGIRQMQSSMQKMQAHPMDLMQIHNLVDWQTHLKTLYDWKAQGKIKYIGITHYTVSAFDRLMQIMRDEKIEAVQLPYSIITREAEQQLLPLAADRGIAVIVNQPYESGSLFRAVKGKEVPAWAQEFADNSWGQFFLKYILSHPAVTCVIPGTDNPKHMRDNAGAGLGELPDEKTRQKMAAYIKAI